MHAIIPAIHWQIPVSSMPMPINFGSEYGETQEITYYKIKLDNYMVKINDKCGIHVMLSEALIFIRDFGGGH